MTIAPSYLDAAAGRDLPALVTKPIDPLTLALFAGGSGDHNPIHLDPAFAQRYGFDNVFAHGMLSMAYLGRLLTNWAPPERIRDFSTRFVSITPLRSVVVCAGTIAEIVTDEGVRCARLKLTTTVAGNVLTCSGAALVILD